MTVLAVCKQRAARMSGGANDGVPTMKSRALLGSAWTLGGYGTQQILRLGSHLILAWLLAPQIFGLMALVKVVQHGLNMFSDIGIKPSIIQNPRGDDAEFLNTAWTIQIIRGFVLWFCACILAWPFAALFARTDESAWQLAVLLPVAGFVAVLQGFNSTALATLNRHLRLGRLTMVDLSSQIVSLTVMITWALIHPTVWAMVGGGLAGAAYKMVASHVLVPGQRVRMTWNHDCARELLRFGKWIFLSTLVTFLALNLDKLILGNVLTLDQLGLYAIALVFCKVALHVSTRLGGTVLFPVYSKYQNDEKRMMAVALRSREAVLWVGMAACISFAIIAPLFFQTLWDHRYHAAGAIAQWMSLYIWFMIVLQTMDRIPLAMGNSRALFFANIWRCLGIIPAIGGYMLAELPGFLVGLMTGPLIAHVYLLKHVPAKRREMFMQAVRFTFGGLAYGVPAVAVTSWIAGMHEPWIYATCVGLIAVIPICVSAMMVWSRIRGNIARPVPAVAAAEGARL